MVNNSYPDDFEQEIRTSAGDPDIEGLFCNQDGNWFLDRRKKLEVAAELGLSPRTADLNLVGSDILPVPAYLAEQLALGQK